MIKTDQYLGAVVSTFESHPITYSVFSGGEVHLNADHVAGATSLTIRANLTSSERVMAFVMLVDALRRNVPHTTLKADLRYFPYARQDRVCNPGEALSAAAMAGIINSLRLDSVVLWDPHSDVSPALINNLVTVPQYELVPIGVPKIGKYMIVCPDSGARKKCLDLTTRYNLDCVFADKVRDTKTGDITGTAVYDGEKVKGRKLLIVDDICDGGFTFIKLAEALTLYEPKSIELYVTHGIFSKGAQPLFDAGISDVHTPYAWSK